MTRLIIFYGPPAVGKLTFAKKISTTLSAFLIHNHLTYDEITKETGLKFGSELLQKKNAQMRLDILKSLFERGDETVILTFCYEPHSDQGFINDLRELCETYSVSVNPVLLYANKETLLSRCSNVDRSDFGKVRDPFKLEASLDKYNFTAAFPIGDKLIKVDTSKDGCYELACKKIIDLIYKKIVNDHLPEFITTENNPFVETHEYNKSFFDYWGSVGKYITLGMVSIIGLYAIYNKFFSNNIDLETGSNDLLGDSVSMDSDL